MFKKGFHLLHRHYHLRYKDVYRHAKKLFIFDLLLLGLSITMLVTSLFFFFWKPGLTDLVDLNISLGNKRTSSGEYVHLTIDYLNRSEFKLEATSLSLHLPDGFVIDRDKTPLTVFDKNSIFPTIKTLPSGTKGQVEIYGWFWSEPNQEEKFIASLSYKPENSTKREQKISHFLARLPDSLLNGQLVMASSTFAKQKLNFTYKLTNNSQKEIKNISLSHNWPNNIFIKQINEFPLKSQQTKTLKGQITTPAKGGSFSLAITPKVKIKNKFIKQSTTKKDIQIITPILYSQADFPSNIYYIEPSAIIPLNITWKNKSNFTLQNLKMRVKANYPQLIDWPRTAKENHLKLENNQLIIDNQARTKFSDGKPNNTDSFQIKLYLKPYFNLDKIINAYLKITPIMEANLGKLAGQKYSEPGNLAKLPIATEIKLTAQSRYYTSTGDQIGRGPLPPQVGKTTKYWIFIRIDNTTNPIKNTFLKTSLPAGVELTGRDSVTIGPNIKYDKNTRTITWNYINNIPANSYSGIYFEVQVIPSATQVGQAIKLTNDINLTATDSLVNKKFNLKQAGLNNILQTNDIGAKKGYKIKL